MPKRTYSLPRTIQAMANVMIEKEHLAADIHAKVGRYLTFYTDGKNDAERTQSRAWVRATLRKNEHIWAEELRLRAHTIQKEIVK